MRAGGHSIAAHRHVALETPIMSRRALVGFVPVGVVLAVAFAPFLPGRVHAEDSYEETFTDLYRELGRRYPCFALKKIDWQAVGKELLPRAKKVQTEDEFAILCVELVARLEDSHATLLPGSRELPKIPFPRWDPGLTCLTDDRGRPVVYHVDRGSPAQRAGIGLGDTIVEVDRAPVKKAIDAMAAKLTRYVGYSSERYLRYQATRWFLRREEKGDTVTVGLISARGKKRRIKLQSTMDVRYLPRLPVPIKGISDSADVAWTTLPGDIGYIYVRRIRADLIDRLDAAVGELAKAKALIIDVRGNSGGGFDAARSHRNFDTDDEEEPDRPRFKGPMAVLLAPRCISAGEGWASWFIAEKRARAFGEATAGASGRKTIYELKNGHFKVRFPVKAYRGFLDRPIERRGLEPDEPVRQKAKDLARGRDTVLEAARAYLLAKTKKSRSSRRR